MSQSDRQENRTMKTPEQIAADLLDGALATLIDAARKWSTELDEYIIPSAQETSEEDAASYRAQRDEIDRAIELAELVLTAPVDATT